MDAEGAATTLGMVQCLQSERAQWRAVRDAAVLALDDTLDAHERWSQTRCA